MSLSGIEALNEYRGVFAPEIPHAPAGRFASVVLLRETKSYAIFTTEGGEQQDTERTQAGLRHSEPIDRLVMFKRKQVAPERRTGKALMRQYGVFPHAVVRKDREVVEVVYGAEAIAAAQARYKAKSEKVEVVVVEDCYLTAQLCTHCPDCLIYGYAAVEGEGARKARVMTDSCFSVRPYPLIQKGIKFNVIDEREQTSGTITEFDYTMPEVFLPAVVTTVDLTLDEFVYVLGNILRTTRYGKEASRQGFVRNHVMAISFSDVELFANLELTQAFYDAFVDGGMDLAAGGLSRQDFERHLPEVLKRLTAEINGRLTWVTGGKLQAILDEVRALNQDEACLSRFLRDLNTQAAKFGV
ncbi:MAG: type I-D CRISPR-associated protein Cas7/Csc2 [Bacillota bacterium]